MPTQGNWYYQDYIPALCLKNYQESRNLCNQPWYISVNAPELTLISLIQFFKEDHKKCHGSGTINAKLLRQAILWLFKIDPEELRKHDFLWSDIFLQGINVNLTNRSMLI